MVMRRMLKLRKLLQLGRLLRKEAIMIELTEEQRQAVKNGEAIRVTAVEIGEDVVLLRATQYEAIRELLEDRRERRSFRAAR
jgi:hypothetical protein